MQDEDIRRETPPVVVGAVAAGCAPLPFLGVYAILFIVHGGFHPVVPPDITNSARGELYAGLITLAIFIVSVVALLWMLNGRRRWPFVIVELAVLATTIDFALDDTKGGRTVSVALAVTAVVALVCALLPDSWGWVGASWKLPGRARKAEVGEAGALSAGVAEPTLAAPAAEEVGS